MANQNGSNANSFQLKDLPQKIRFCQRLQEPADKFDLIVVRVYRYLKDPSYYLDTDTQRQSNDFNDLDLYDLLLTDGVELIKCLLSPTCNRLVQTYQLHAGSILQLNPLDCKLHSSEKEVDSEPFIIINQLELTGYSSRDLNINNLPFCDAWDSTQMLEKPLVTSRGCYMSLWNNEDPYGSCWTNPMEDAEQNISNPTIAIAMLAQNWKTLSRPYPSLVVRVLHRARIHCFAKHDKFEKWPFQLQLEVADASGIVSVVGWNRVTCLLYSHVEEGSALLLSHYTVRDRYALMAQPQKRNHRLCRFDLEIALNANKAEVEILDPSVALNLRLPLPEFCFLTRQEMRHLGCIPNEVNLDIVGIVCHVGRYMRKCAGEYSSQFWLCRWVHLFDGSSLQPVRLLLFSTSQPEEHNKIVPGVILLVTQLRLVVTEIQETPGCYRKKQYVTTTTVSQISVFTAHVTEPLASHSAVHHLKNWCSSKEAQTVLQTSSSVAGYNSYPALPLTLDDYRATFTAEKPLTPTLSSAVPDMVQSLSFRESLRIHFLGYVASIAFHSIARRPRPSASNVPSNSSRTRLEMQRTTSSIGVDYQASRQGVSSTEINQDALPPVDVDPLWQRIKDQLQVIGSAVPPPSFFARKYQPGFDDPAVLQSLLMPSESVVVENDSRRGFEDLPVVKDMEGYFVVTLIGVNDNISVYGFLPLVNNDDSCFSLYSDSPEEPGLLSLLRGHSVAWPKILAGKTHAEHVRWLMEESKSVYNHQMLFLLDFYNPGFDETTEVFINRGYLKKCLSSLEQDNSHFV